MFSWRCQRAGRKRRVRSTKGVLGIPEVRKPPNLAKRGGCWFEHDALMIQGGNRRQLDVAGCEASQTRARLLTRPGRRRLLVYRLGLGRAITALSLAGRDR